MKNVIRYISLAICALVFYSCSSSEKNSLEDQNLKGQIHSYSEYYYGVSEKFGEIQKEQRVYGLSTGFPSNHKFNNEGNIVETTYFDASDEIISKAKYEYDDKSNLSEVTMYNAQGNLAEKTIYHYNNNGLVSHEILYLSDGKEFKITYFNYDKNLRLTQQIDSVVGKYSNLLSYKFDSKNRLITKKFVNQHVEYKYKGNLRTESKLFDKSGNPLYYTFYEYDAFDNLVKDESYSYKKRETDIDSNYYVYDHMNNWIKRISFDNGTPEILTERSFVYAE